MRKLAVLILAATLVLGGCTGAKQGSGNQTAFSGYPIQTEEVLTFWVANPSTLVTNYGETPFAKELAKRTGVNVEYLHPPAGVQNQNQALSLLIASDDLPDMVQYTWLTFQGGPEKMIEEEVILDLTELIDAHAPNLKKYLNEHPEIDRAVRTDIGKKYYVFPLIREDKILTVSTGPVYRKDWLDELGLDVPETFDEVENALRLFRDKKGATAPLSTNTASYLTMYTGGIETFYVDNGVVKFGPLEPEYKESLERLRKWYEEGLLDRNFVSTDASSGVDANLLNGRTGLTQGSGGANMGSWLANATSEGFDLVAGGWPVKNKGDAGNQAVIPSTAQYNGAGSVAISASCKNPVLAVQYLDWNYSEEGHMFNCFGIEGESYTMIDGYPTYTDLIMKNSDGNMVSQMLAMYVRSSTGGPFVTDKRYLEQYYQLPQQKDALNTWFTQLEGAKIEKMPHVTIPVAKSSDDASTLLSIIDYVSEMRSKFILGTEPLENYDKFIERLKALKIDTLLETRQQAYENYNK